MEIVKETEEYQIIKKRSGRYGVRGANRKWISGDEKVKILIAEGILKAPEPKPEPEPEAADADTGGDADASADSDAGAEEEKPAEEG
jgi:hypothetical protein